MAATQDYTEDMAQGDFSNGSYGDSYSQQQEQQLLAEPAAAASDETAPKEEAMEEATNGDNGHTESGASSGHDLSGKDEDR